MSKPASFRKSIRIGLVSAAMLGAFGAATILPAHEKAEAAAPAPADRDAARQLFNDWSCGSCHALKDAGGTGHVGPSFDGTVNTVDFVKGRITNGQGAMPAFGGLMSDEEIDMLASYIVEAAEKPE
jgi:mono/diheme cytochrome c family protein